MSDRSNETVSCKSLGPPVGRPRHGTARRLLRTRRQKKSPNHSKHFLKAPILNNNAVTRECIRKMRSCHSVCKFLRIRVSISFFVGAIVFAFCVSLFPCFVANRSHNLLYTVHSLNRLKHQLRYRNPFFTRPLILRLLSKIEK